MNFISHARLLDQPDPRRLDLRASIGNIRKEWLVRVNQQRAAVNVSAIVDVSAPMHFGAKRSKLQVAGDFLQALGDSAAGIGDPVGLQVFDQHLREDLAVPLQFRRGAGQVMADIIRHSSPSSRFRRASIDALSLALERVSGRSSLVFIISDFHWPLEELDSRLDLLAGAMVVPLVIWDIAEVAPPEGRRLLPVRQMGSRQRRHVWLNPRVRQQWRANVARRRQEIAEVFASRDVQPFWMTGRFDAEALSRYFLEASVQ